MKKLLVMLPLVALICSCKDAPEVKLPHVEYKTIKVKKQEVEVHQNLSASLQGQQDVDIVPQAEGTLTKICVQPGQVVKRGQTLFIVNQVQQQAELRSALAEVKVAQAQAATAKINLESKQQLKDKKIISDILVKKAQNEYQTSLAQIEQAEARVTNARESLSYATVKSPCDGIVGVINYREGALVGPGILNPLTTVSNNRNIYADIAISEAEMLTLMNSDTVRKNNGDFLSMLPPVKLKTTLGQYYPEEGKITSISGVINKTTGTMTVRAVFPNPTGILKSGGAATVEISMKMKDVLVIPQTATYELQDKVFVYKVVNNKAKSVEVKVVPLDDAKHFAVTGGLKEGDVVISDGAGNVTEGEEVSFDMKM
ncbi:MAG: efflux RND transporter periplasmic adaptor subunit [Bacteroidaceae bacterium]|nr:efflux RND transporter periplasmic adaptor subunit [Bacteroidaceae bacterium]